MLNRFPYNPAHLMAATTRHVASLADLTPAEREGLLAAVILGEQALAAEYRPHGTNLGANLGRVAGAGFPGHLHVHVVPRWNGDTNFMPVVAETRVLPESLTRTWSRLRGALAKAGASRSARAARAGRTPAAGAARAATRGPRARGTGVERGSGRGSRARRRRSGARGERG
jgi:ATP adenylyltransferase